MIAAGAGANPVADDVIQADTLAPGELGEDGKQKEGEANPRVGHRDRIREGLPNKQRSPQSGCPRTGRSWSPR